MNNFLDGLNLTGQKVKAAGRSSGSALAKNPLTLLTGVACTGMILIFVPKTSGQTVATGTERAQLLQGETQPPFGASGPEGFVDGRAVSSPNDPDIGVQELLTAGARYEPFTVSLATPVFFTSNVVLTPNNEKSDVVFAPTVSAFYDPQLTPTLYAHFGAREQVFYYGEHTEFNFASLDCQAGLTYLLPQYYNLILRAWYDFNRFTFDDRLGDEFFSDHRIILNAELPFRLGRAQQISVGTDANLSVGADHQFPRRNDYESYIGYSVGLTRSFSIQAAGRFVVRHYHQNDRNDVSEIVSAEATYRVANWCSLSAISSFAHNESNQEMFDYDVGDVGGVLELTIKF